MAKKNFSGITGTTKTKKEISDADIDKAFEKAQNKPLNTSKTAQKQNEPKYKAITIQFPAYLYDAIKEKAGVESTTFKSIVIRHMRKGLGFED